MTLYEQNLNALLTTNPKLAARLYGLQGNEKFDVFVDKNDILNVNILCQNEPIYEGVARDEIVGLCDSFEAEYMHYPYLYFYGIGNGLLYKLLLQNDEHKKIIIVEKELELIYIALHFNNFQEEILNEKLIILLQEDISFGQLAALYYDQAMRLYARTFHLEIHNSFYEKYYMDDIVAINRLFIKSLEHAVNAAGNDSIDALIGIQHQVANAKKMVYTPTLLEVVKKAKNSDIAVIVATGPSLKKQLSLLKEIQEHVTIFCADSSFPILYKEGIKPDIVLSLERVAETAQFFASVPKEGQNDVVFAITSIAHPDIFKEIKSGTLHVSQRPFGYTRFFEMHEYGYAGIGMSVANLAYEYAFHSKFKTIVLIGQDLAYAPDGSSHSDGHIYGIDDKDEKLANYEVVAYGGNGTIKTNKIWVLFKNAFETDIYNTKNEGVVTINATEGGARIDGALEVPFNQVIQEYIDRNFLKQSIKLDDPIPLMLDENIKKIDQKIKYMSEYAKARQQEVEDVFLQVMEECEKLDSLDVYNNLEKADYTKLAWLMDQIDNIKAYFEDEEFTKIFMDATQAMVVNLEMELAKIKVRIIRTEDERRKKMLDWVYAHRAWLFSLAGMIQATVDAINMGLEMTLEFESIECIKVYVNGEKIDQIRIDHADPFMKNLADIKQVCSHYELDAKYSDKSNTLQFFYSNEEETFKEQVQIPLKDDTNFTRFAFLNSLESTIDYTKFKKESKSEDDKSLSIGLLPLAYIDEHQEMIEAIKKICHSFPEVSFKFICFRDEEIEITKHIFAKELQSIEFIAPSDIYELYTLIDMFIYDLESLEDKRLYGIRYILNSTKEVKVPQLNIVKHNDEELTLSDSIDTILMMVSLRYTKHIKIDVYLENEKIDEIQQSAQINKTISDVKQLCFKYKIDGNDTLKSKKLSFVYIDEERENRIVIQLPQKNDKRYEEFVFKNTLDLAVDTKRLENLYEKDAIGFLAVKENIDDEDFTHYIKELLVKFPQIKCKAFYFTDEQKESIHEVFKLEIDRFELIVPQDIYHLASEIELYTTANNHAIWLNVLFDIFLFNCSNIYTYRYDKKSALVKIDESDWQDDWVGFKNPYIGLTIQDLEKLKYNPIKAYTHMIWQLLKLNKVIDDEYDVYSFTYFQTIEYVLNNGELKQHFCKLHNYSKTL